MKFAPINRQTAFRVPGGTVFGLANYQAVPFLHSRCKTLDGLSSPALGPFFWANEGSPARWAPCLPRLLTISRRRTRYLERPYIPCLGIPFS